MKSGATEFASFGLEITIAPLVYAKATSSPGFGLALTKNIIGFDSDIRPLPSDLPLWFSTSASLPSTFLLGLPIRSDYKIERASLSIDEDQTKQKTALLPASRISHSAFRTPHSAFPAAFTPPKLRGRFGFTLLELLVVIGIMTLLLVALVPAVTSLSKSNNINTAGRMVANSLTVARSEAINQRTLIRFEVATNWPNDSAAAYRKFTLVQHDVTTGTDKQLTKWETLPDGLTFNPQDPTPGTGSYFFSVGQSQNPKLTSGGQAITTTYIEFSPTGALSATPVNNPVRLRLVQGYVSLPSTSVVSTGTSNWLETTVDSFVGRIRIARP